MFLKLFMKIDWSIKGMTILKDILKSKFDFNENNVPYNNIDKIWKTVKISRNNSVNN